MYDVIYIDAHGSETPVAQHVDDRKEATDVARQAAAERGAGRMVLPGLDEAAQLRLRRAGATAKPRSLPPGACPARRLLAARGSIAL